MKKENLKQKNKEGVANIILVIGIITIIIGFIFGISDMTENAGKAFFVCAAGTILTFVSNYLKNGYIKFFN